MRSYEDRKQTANECKKKVENTPPTVKPNLKVRKKIKKDGGHCSSMCMSNCMYLMSQQKLYKDLTNSNFEMASIDC